MERLLELGQDKNVDVQSSADYALGRVAGPSTPNAVRRAAEHLMALGKDANADVRIRAADTLGILCRTAPEDIARRVVERLSDISSDDNYNVRRSEIDSLGVLGNVGNHSTSKLAEAVAVLVDPKMWNALLKELETWRDSFDALEAKYRLAVSEEEVIDWEKAKMELAVRRE